MIFLTHGLRCARGQLSPPAGSTPWHRFADRTAADFVGWTARWTVGSSLALVKNPGNGDAKTQKNTVISPFSPSKMVIEASNLGDLASKTWWFGWTAYADSFFCCRIGPIWRADYGWLRDRWFEHNADIAAKTNHLIHIGIFGSVGSLTPFPALCLKIPMSSKDRAEYMA